MSDTSSPGFPGGPPQGPPGQSPLGPLSSPPGMSTPGLGPDGFARVAPQSMPFDGPPPGGKPGKAPKAKRGKQPKGPAVAGEQSAKAATKRTVSINRVLFLGAAVVVGLAVVILVSVKPASTYVVVTTQQIPSLSQVTSTELTAVPAQTGNVAHGAFTGPSVKAAVANALAKTKGESTAIPLVNGQQVFTSAFATNSALNASLGPDDRLISVNAPVSNAVGGSLSVGDHVDVIAASTGVVAPDATVVSIRASQSQYDNAAAAQNSSKGSTPSQLLPTDPVPGIYILKTSSENAANITTALQTAGGGQLVLVYRAPLGA